MSQHDQQVPHVRKLENMTRAIKKSVREAGGEAKTTAIQAGIAKAFGFGTWMALVAFKKEEGTAVAPVEEVPTGEPGFACGACDFATTDEDDFTPIYDVRHLFERVNPGEVLPAGECPECGHFVHVCDNVVVDNEDAAELAIEKLEAFRDAICEELAAQPENPNADQLEASGKALSVKVSELFEHDNLTASFYSFKAQHEKLIKTLRLTKAEYLLDTLDLTVKTGKANFMGKPVQLHPGVVEQLKSIYEPKWLDILKETQTLKK